MRWSTITIRSDDRDDNESTIARTKMRRPARRLAVDDDVDAKHQSSADAGSHKHQSLGGRRVKTSTEAVHRRRCRCGSPGVSLVINSEADEQSPGVSLAVDADVDEEKSSTEAGC